MQSTRDDLDSQKLFSARRQNKDRLTASLMSDVVGHDASDASTCELKFRQCEEQFVTVSWRKKCVPPVAE